MTIATLVASPLVQSAFTGLVAAAAVDFVAFRSWKSFDDALAYNWKVATFRWLQGAVLGAVTGLGYGAIVG